MPTRRMTLLRRKVDSIRAALIATTPELGKFIEGSDGADIWPHWRAVKRPMNYAVRFTIACR